MSQPSLRWRLILALLRRLPQGALSRATGHLADLPVPRPLRRPVIGGFAWWVGLDREEAVGDPRDYPSVGAYFVRRLKEGAREWPEDPALLASPVDGIVGAVGEIRAGTVLQAKGMPYRVRELLAEGRVEEGGYGEESADEGSADEGSADEGSADEGSVAALDPHRFEGGRYVTLYLSPRHYHRIHSPLSGSLVRARAIPGKLLPVNEPAIQGVPRLFPRNERLVLHLEGESGPVALVAVGAFNVGRISVAFDPAWNGSGRSRRTEGVTNRPGKASGEVRDYEPPVPLLRGAEVAAFHLGSTVVLLLGPDPAGQAPRLAPAVVPGREIRLGEAITLRSTAPARGSGPGNG